MEGDSEGRPFPSATSGAPMLHRTAEGPDRPEQLVGDTKPAVTSRSSARILHRIQESPERLISGVKSTVASTSFDQTQYGGLDRAPLVIRQSPKIVVRNLLAEEDYPTMDFWTRQRTSGQSTVDALHPSAPMVYAVPTSPPVLQESKKEVFVKKEEPKAPAVNISALSARVYSMIESRLKIDRERRGVCA